MSPRKVTVPLSFGRTDRVDPKLAPFGALAVARNLRVRKDGRLASRNGYQPLTMGESSIGGTMVAFDLHEFQNGRLVAAGAHQSEGSPNDLYEYVGSPSATPWRPSDGTGAGRTTITPMTAPRSVCGVPQPAGGIQACDCAAGGGFVCTVYRGVGAFFVGIQIVRESDDQVIFARSGGAQGWSGRIRVCWSVDRFYFLAFDGAGTDLELGSFVPGTSTAITVLATVEAAALSTMNFEIEPVTNPSASAVVLIYGDGASASTNVLIKRYNSAGAQQGSTLTLAAQVRPFRLAIEADEAANQVNSLVSQHDGSGSITGVSLRTHNFANTLLNGPTAMNAGYRATLCRLRARPGWLESLAVVSSAIDAFGTLVVQWVTIATHAISFTRDIGNAMLASAIIPAANDGQPAAVVFGGFTSAKFGVETNALWRFDLAMAHMTTRDLRQSARNAEDFFEPLGLSLDTSTGRLAWQSLYFSGEAIENFTITTLALNSAARRQSCSAGGLLYLAGAPIQVYDGHSASEACFNEVPGIKSILQSTGGSLSLLGTYSYVYVCEYTLPDGTFFEGPPSPPVTVTMTGTNRQNQLTLTGPHSERVALGDAAYGAEVTGVIYRTVWDAVNGSQGSQFQEVARLTCTSNISAYGDDLVVSDTLSDTAAATRPILYTQGGPVENNAPEAGTYVTSSSARVLVTGLARTFEFQESKEQELDEAVNWSSLSSFIGRAPNPINGAVSLDGIRMIFTRTDLYIALGDGAAQDASGALPQPVELASPGGLKDWRSLLKGPDGVWAQFDDSKLYRVPRGAGAPEWLGVDVQDTLASFSTVTGACRVRADDALAFAASNGDPGTDSRLLVRSLRTGLWTEDQPPLTGAAGIRALCAFGDRLAYVSGGVVFAQNTGFTDAAASVIVTQWKTYPIYPFEMGGNGKVFDMQATGEFRSAGDLALRVSYDNGATFPDTYDTFTLSGLAVGSTVEKQWAIRQDDLQSVVFEVTFTPATPGEGFILSSLTLLVESAPGLKDLPPGDLA